jgi:acetyl esterase/lipase
MEKGEIIMSEMSDNVRKMFKEGDDIRDEGLTSPEDVVRYDDIVYGTDPKWQSMDVYRPKAAEGKVLPVIVSIHGGGWVYGDKERYQYYCMSLAQNGFAVVNYTYRLAPEFQFPASMEDANLVFAWVLAHASEYGMDKDHIFAVGDSAGAHQLGLYANILTNPQYAAKYPFTAPEGLKLTGIALNCGAYVIDVKNEADAMTGEIMKDYLPNHGQPEELDMINVVNYVTDAFPPVFYMTCTGDFLAAQAAPLEKALMEHKIPRIFRYYGDANTELGHVFHCNMKLDIAHKCNKDECDFFKSLI